MTCFSTKKADNKVMRYTFTQTPRKLKFITKINDSRDKKPQWASTFHRIH